MTGDQADLAAQAALSVDGVTGLHGGSFGEVATYLPGRQVAGVTVRDEGTTVHLAVAFGADLRQVADEVRRRVGAVAPEPVEVVVEDVTTPPDDTPPGSESDHHPPPPRSTP